jgi:hypothetical protein
MAAAARTSTPANENIFQSMMHLLRYLSDITSTAIGWKLLKPRVGPMHGVCRTRAARLFANKNSMESIKRREKRHKNMPEDGGEV